MVKSSKTSILFSNANRLNTLSIFISEYQRVCQFFIDLLWDVENIKKLIEKEFTSKVNTWFSQRAIQCAAKQASGIIRGTRQKQKQRMFKHDQFVKEGKFKKARKLQQIIDKVKMSKPEIKSLQPELDSRFVKVDWENNTSFDGWITLTSLGNKLKIILPIKKTKHFNWLKSRGTVKTGMRFQK